MLFFGGCLPPVERSLLELASFIRSQASRTSGRIFVTVNALQGSGLVLSLNNSEDLSVAASGEVNFLTSLSPGSSYSVTVKTQPTNPTQTCTVSGGNGNLVSGDVRSINVNCGVASYTLGGTITGLLGSGLVLSNNGTDTVSISANGSFAFTNTYPVGSAYSVSVSSVPIHPTQNCAITNSAGTFASAANISNISISCTTTGRAVRVNVTGIASGSLVLANNLSDSLTISSNGSYVFGTDVSIGSNYSVTVSSSPSSHSCLITGSTGTIGGTDATVAVNCFSLLAQTPANLSVIANNQAISFRFSAAVTNSSCVFGTGNLTTGGTTSFSVSTTNITDDTLTLSTSTVWNSASVSQVFTCTSAAGNALAAGSFTFRYMIPSVTRYVSINSGSNANPGTIALPYQTIPYAITALSPCGTPPCVILVEDGTYETTTFITVLNNISLYGGYTAGTSFSSRNTSAKLTIIQKSAPSDCGGALFSGLNPCRTLLIDPAVTNATVVDGFRIIAPSSPNDTVAVAMTSGRVILSNNTLQGGTANNSAGLFMTNFGGSNINDNTMGAVVNNIITGGSCTPVSCQTAGIFFHSTTAGLYPFIQVNSVTGGTCSSLSCKSYGFFLSTANSPELTLLKFNTISGGTISPLPGSSESYGIYLNSSSVGGTVSGNSFNGGAADTTAGVVFNVTIASLSMGDNTAKIGNTIYGGNAGSTSYGIRVNFGGNVYSNSIHAGSVSTSNIASTIGIYSAGGLVNINGNRVYGGNATATGSSLSASYGLNILGPSANSNIIGNHISAGTSNNSGTSNSFTYGAFFSSVLNAPVNIANNMIDGGTCILSNSANTCESYGMVINQNFIATAIVYNTIYSGVAEDSSTPLRFQAVSSQNANVQNNILYTESGATSRICLVHDGTTESNNLTNLRGNVFYGCPTLVKYPVTAADSICAGGVVSDNVCSVNSISTPSGLNVYVNPLQSVSITAFNMRFRTYNLNSPCSATRILNVLGAPTLDSLGYSRPGTSTGISAGAVEYDGTCQ